MPRVEVELDHLLNRFRAIRRATTDLVVPLTPDDCQAQSMPSASPVKWHLAHTTWFFETFVLKPYVPEYRPFDGRFTHFFNSYYEGVGERNPQADRGRMTRPSLDEVMKYRRHVDRHMESIMEYSRDVDLQAAWGVVETGLHHEQQHQELILADLKHLLSMNPLKPAYHPGRGEPSSGAPGPLRWLDYSGGVVKIGARLEDGFCYDNEAPRHEKLLQPFRMAARPVTCGEYLRFMEDGGYRSPELWLSDGWDLVKQAGWEAPLYWERRQDGTWAHFTLHGVRPVEMNAPVCHVSYFEADAYVRWAGAVLPSEEEWEIAVRGLPVSGNTAEDHRLRPAAAAVLEAPAAPQQMYGDVWEWTRSPYVAYPGFRALPGVLGEYNGKFMANRHVLRGGSFATPRSHLRATYRNYWTPDTRWQFSGFRLARPS